MVLSIIIIYLNLFSIEISKGQALANFLADHPYLKREPGKDLGLGIYKVAKNPWTLKFDGSSTKDFTRAEVVIDSPKGVKTIFSFNLDFKCTNNQAEYEALVIGLEILLNLKAKEVYAIREYK